LQQKSGVAVSTPPPQVLPRQFSGNCCALDALKSFKTMHFGTVRHWHVDCYDLTG
jgi:hypothetical protein